MISFVKSYMISCCKQDCVTVVVLSPYPNNQHPVESFNVKTEFGLQLDGLGVVCAPSTLLQLHLVSCRRQGGQKNAQGGIPGVFQHV